MSATATLSASIVVGYAAVGTANFAALTAALAIVTGVLGILFGLLRLGFLASFISEPVLKGFIVGLALTIIIGQVPKLLGVTRARATSSSSCGTSSSSSGRRPRDTGDRARAAWCSCWGCAGSCRWSPGPWSRCCSSIAAVAIWNLDEHGIDIVGPITSGLPQLGCPQGVGATTTSSWSGRRSGCC